MWISLVQESGTLVSDEQNTYTQILVSKYGRDITL